jgi:ubiquitin-protein ligase
MTDPIRLQADFDRLRALAAASGERISLLAGPTPGSLQAEIEFRYAVARSERYPSDVTRQTRLRISLPARYPFQPPVATVLTPIWHPNVFPAGTICLGTKWLASEGLDLFVQRLARLLTFDSLLVNTASPANRAAADWYQRTRSRHPDAFPSDRPLFGETERGTPKARVGWRDTPAGEGRVERSCPGCGRTLRLPAGRRGRVRCPGCSVAFEAVT